MASHLQPLFILLLFTITDALPIETHPFQGGFLLKLTKDIKTHQYTTQLLCGTPQIPTKLVVDISGHSIWLKCPPISSSRHLVRHNSLPCLMAKSISNHDRKKAATICEIQQENPITGVAYIGDLAEDIVNVDGNGPAVTVVSFLFSCSPEYLLKGLATGVKGVLGFGRSKIAFQSQMMVNSFDFPRKFTLCLSSSAGFINSGISNSLSLSYTPLISTHGVHGYYVNVNSIKVRGRRLALQPIEGVEISSIVPYTTMKSTIYSIFTKAYVSAANSMNMTVVPPVAPFGVCFKSQSKVPEIEFVLQSEMVKWGIQRRNSMVQVSQSVMCLGFLDGGLDMNGSVVFGGYQLEDRIMEINLGTGMIGISSSLVMYGNSCSNIRESLSTPTESL